MISTERYEEIRRVMDVRESNGNTKEKKVGILYTAIPKINSNNGY
jgi:hypothetical protein